VKPWLIRFPDELVDWIRVRAAERTIREKQNVSMNTVVVETLTKAMKEDLKRKEKRKLEA
jgi:hypothetical protein